MCNAILVDVNPAKLSRIPVGEGEVSSKVVCIFISPKAVWPVSEREQHSYK